MKILSILFFAVFLAMGSESGARKKPTKKLPPKEATPEAIRQATEVPVVSPETAPPESDQHVRMVNSVSSSSSDKFMNFTMNPTPIILGGIDTGLDFKVADHWQIGPHLLLLNFKISSIEFSNHGIGLRTIWTPINTALTEGPYLLGLIGGSRISASTTDSTGRYTAGANAAYLSLGGGYHWYWTNFNIRLGLAASTASIRNIEIYNASNALVSSGGIPMQPTLTFDLGFAL